LNLRYLVILVIVLVCSGEQASGPCELTQEVEWADDRGGNEGDAPAVHDGVQAEDRAGGQRL
jgi:hypothetical protein